MNTIEIKNLTRDYGNGCGIFDLSFEVAKGEAFGFLGPNGAGKTTTIRHLMGFLQAKSGSCSISGQDCWTNRASIQANLGYIPGEISFFDDMSGSEFLKFIAGYRAVGQNNRTKELMDRFELSANGKIKKMSKGTKQKMGIIAAFMHDPDILILDEPTSGLDPLMQNRFTELILEEKARGKTIIMSSHMFEEVERTCQRVGIIRNGKLVALESVEKLKAAQLKKYVITFAEDTAAQSFAQEKLTTQLIANNQVSVTVQNDMQNFISAMQKYPVTNISAPNQSLEEIFLQYYGGEKNV